jgi:hypothetical protein
MFDQTQYERRDSKRDGVNSLLWTLKALAGIIWPFTRKDVGAEVPGTAALGTIVVLVGLALWTNSVAAWVLLWLWLLGLLRLRAMWLRNRKKMYIPLHWDGTPWLMQKLLPRLTDLSKLKSYEGFLVMAVGGLVTYADAPVGGLLFIAGFASFCVEQFAYQLRKNRVSAMRQANWEMQQTIDDYESGEF